MDGTGASTDEGNDAEGRSLASGGPAGEPAEASRGATASGSTPTLQGDVGGVHAAAEEGVAPDMSVDFADFDFQPPSGDVGGGFSFTPMATEPARVGHEATPRSDGLPTSTSADAVVASEAEGAAESGGSGGLPQSQPHGRSSHEGDVGGPPEADNSRGVLFEPLGVGPGGTAERVEEATPRGDVGGDGGDHDSSGSSEDAGELQLAAPWPVRPASPPAIFGPAHSGSPSLATGGSGESSSTGAAGGNGGSGGSDGTMPTVPAEGPGDVGGILGVPSAVQEGSGGGSGELFEPAGVWPLDASGQLGALLHGDVGGNTGEHQGAEDSDDDEPLQVPVAAHPARSTTPTPVFGPFGGAAADRKSVV